MKTIINRPEAVTHEWLSEVLHRNGFARDTEVMGVRPVLVKKLQVSTVCRLLVEYRSDGPAAPRNLFLKLGGSEEHDGRNIGQAEVEFYREVAPRMSCPPLIKCYDAAFNDHTGRSHILFEDLSETHSQPPEHQPPSEEMSRHAVEALAKVHRYGWRSDSVETDQTIGTPFTEEWLESFVEDLHKSVAEFRAAAALTSQQELMYEQMLRRAPSVWGRLTDARGLTVTHGDMHWWNFLYPRDPARHSVRIFDWHTWHIDLGARDLAFLLALGGFAEPRPQLEEDLLRVYHEALGVERYSFEMLMDDYRWSAIRNLNIPVIFWKQGKHYSTWQDALRRACDAYERLGCRDVG